MWYGSYNVLCSNLSSICALMMSFTFHPSGSFLQVLGTSHLVKVFAERPQLAAQYPDLLLGNLSDLDLSQLLQLAEVLDPSKPVVCGYIHRKLRSQRRTSSMTSLTGSGEMIESTMRSGNIPVGV